jgi:hypothetical protein
MAAHRWLVLVFGLAVALRLAVAITYRPFLFDDSWSYLDAAYSAFPVGISFARPSGYPLVIKALSLAGHHPFVISTVQHIGGLAGGLLVYLLLTRRQVPRWLAATATGLVLLDLYAIALEQAILSEAFFTLALVGAVYLAICVRPTSLALSGSGALLAAATLMRPAGGFALLAWFLYLAWKRVGLRPLVVGVVSFAIPLLAYAGWQRHVTGYFGLVVNDGWFLYGRIGEIAAPCGDAKIPKATYSLCERSSHGKNALFYTWDAASPAHKAFRRTDGRANRLVREFALAIIRDRPLTYGELVLSDTARYFVPGVSAEYQSQDIPSMAEELPAYSQEVRDRYLPGYVPRAYGSDSWLWRAERWMHTPRWLVAIFVLCALAAPASAVFRRDRSGGGSHGEAIFLVGSGLLILVGSTATSAFDLRYLAPEVPLFVSGGVLAIWQLTSARLPST